MARDYDCHRQDQSGGILATWAWLLPRDVAISIQTQTTTLDAAESIAVNIAKLPDRLSKPEDK
jgi:hypothetical protein